MGKAEQSGQAPTLTCRIPVGSCRRKRPIPCGSPRQRPPRPGQDVRGQECQPDPASST
jgi:hypothetical protein